VHFKKIHYSVMRIAVLFHRFGPYHWARLQAAGERAEVYGIELSGETHEYAWAQVDGPASFERRTVHPDGDIRDLPPAQMRAHVHRVLEEVVPDVVALHGWAAPDAIAALAWCMATDTPAVVMSESTAYDFERPGWKEAVKRRTIRHFQAGLVGGALHKAYLEQLGMPSYRIFAG